MTPLTGRLAALCLLLSAAAAQATESGPAQRTVPAPDPQQRQQWVEQWKMRWNEADANHDGRLSRDEARRSTPRLAERFDRLDADGDGMLTPAELRLAHHGRKRTACPE